MATNDIFKKVPIEIPNKSGFDMSHGNLFTAKCGTLVPCMVDMLLPNDSVSLSVGSEIQLPPMATDFYGRVKAHFEAFFVPMRILYGGWQELMTHPVNGDVWPSSTSPDQKAKFLPTLRLPSRVVGRGSLADYLGFKASTITPLTVDIKNPLRFLAYHKIYDSFYRDSRIQREVFARPYMTDQGVFDPLNFNVLPYVTRYDNSPYVLSTDSHLSCADGVPCYSLRQRNFSRDYFTNATPLPQAGQPAAVAFGINNDQGSFTIQSLRAANALQMWLERNNVAGYRYGDQIRAHFGVYPSDAALDRPLYLGREIVDVYNKSVYQNDGGETSSNSANPFSSVGSKYGSPLGVGKGQLVDNFKATEHGYIFVMFSLVPDAIYSTGVDRELSYNKVADFPWPLLAGIGDQEIYESELIGDDFIGNSTVFGYTQRYANHKHKLDEVHGLLVDGEDLASFALQRGFVHSDNFGLGTEFLQIPTNYLDGVTAVSGDVSKYGCWVDSYFEYHKSSTLPAYSIPTLGNPEHTHTEVVPNGGFRL